MGKIFSRLGWGSYYLTVCMFVFVYGPVSPYPFLAMFLTAYIRFLFRRTFDIPGSCGRDLVASLCCFPCTVAQMSTHAETYRRGDCDFGTPAPLGGYSIV